MTFVLAILWTFKLLDSTGAAHSPEEWKHRNAVVLMFVSTDCPISNRYAPTMNQLVKDYGRQDTPFYAVQSDPDLTPVEAQKHAKDYGFQFPVLMDKDQVLASRYGVAVTPTAVVVSAAGDLLYRGRIDDRAVDFGQWRNVPRKQDLRDAIVSTLNGRAVAKPFPDAIGCFLPPKRTK